MIYFGIVVILLSIASVLLTGFAWSPNPLDRPLEPLFLRLVNIASYLTLFLGIYLISASILLTLCIAIMVIVVLLELKKKSKINPHKIDTSVATSYKLGNKIDDFSSGICDAMAGTYNKRKSSDATLNEVQLLNETLALRPFWSKISDNKYQYKPPFQDLNDFNYLTGEKITVLISELDTIETLTWKIIDQELKYAGHELYDMEKHDCKAIAFKAYKRFFREYNK